MSSIKCSCSQHIFWYFLCSGSADLCALEHMPTLVSRCRMVTDGYMWMVTEMMYVCIFKKINVVVESLNFDGSSHASYFNMNNFLLHCINTNLIKFNFALYVKHSRHISETNVYAKQNKKNVYILDVLSWLSIQDFYLLLVGCFYLCWKLTLSLQTIKMMKLNCLNSTCTLCSGKNKCVKTHFNHIYNLSFSRELRYLSCVLRSGHLLFIFFYKYWP